MNEIEALNSQFSIANQLVFTTAPSGLAIVSISNPHASATIALQGSHLMSWAPKGEKPVVWLSPDAKLIPGKSIRGGVPICWPWFGDHAAEANAPAHGFARTSQWQVIETRTLADGATQIKLELEANNMARQQWPHATTVQCIISVGHTLQMELLTGNCGKNDITISEALHTYFAVSDVRNISIDGLDGCDYQDKVEAFKKKQQAGAVTFSAEVDRLYLNTQADCIIHDPGLSRRIRISKAGSESTVIWNPWLKKAEQMGDDGYLRMVCVESANAGQNSMILAAGAEHSLKVCYSVEKDLGRTINQAR